jgi:hypothetical protein
VTWENYSHLTNEEKEAQTSGYKVISRNEQKSWGCGSSGSVPAWQVQGPAFEPQYRQKKKKKERKKEMSRTVINA